MISVLQLNPHGQYPTEGSMWVPVCPFIHTFLYQDTWTFLGDTHDGRTVDEQLLYNAWDVLRRFNEGYAGWPTTCAEPRPLDVVTFEYKSYGLQPNSGPGIYGTFENVEAQGKVKGQMLIDNNPKLAGVGDGF